jgi:hypothetical protein
MSFRKILIAISLAAFVGASNVGDFSRQYNSADDLESDSNFEASAILPPLPPSPVPEYTSTFVLGSSLSAETTQETVLNISTKIPNTKAASSFTFSTSSQPNTTAPVGSSASIIFSITTLLAIVCITPIIIGV